MARCLIYSRITVLFSYRLIPLLLLLLFCCWCCCFVVVVTAVVVLLLFYLVLLLLLYKNVSLVVNSLLQNLFKASHVNTNTVSEITPLHWTCHSSCLFFLFYLFNFHYHYGTLFYRFMFCWCLFHLLF